MNHLYEIYRVTRILGEHPLAMVILSALIAAILEQRHRKRKTPDFTLDDRDAYGRSSKGRL
jgi:hypothetical protein